MINFDDFFGSLRQRLPQVIGLTMLTLVVTGNLVYGLLEVVPAVRLHSDLSLQVVETRQALTPPSGEAAQEAALRATLTEWQAALEAQAGAFLTEAEVPEVLNHLYRYADESGVEIARVTAAGAAQPEFAFAAGLTVQSFAVEVSGETMRLFDFVTRLQEATRPAVILDQLVIKPGKAPARDSLLGLNVRLFTSAYAAGQAPASP